MPLNPVSCAICNGKSQFVCGQCRTIRYCSIQCSGRDWSVHGCLCPIWCKSLKPEEPKSAEFSRAILFNPDDRKVKIVWVECISESRHGVTGLMTTIRPDVKPFLGPEHPTLGHSYGREFLHKNVRRDRVFEDYTLVLFYPKHPVIIRDKASYIVNNLTDWHPTSRPEFRNEILAMRCGGITDDPTDYQSITIIDFRDVVDCLTLADAPKRDLPVPERGPGWAMMTRGPPVGCVRVRCNGEMLRDGAPRYSAVNVLARDFPDREQAPPTWVSEHVGHPIIALEQLTEFNGQKPNPLKQLYNPAIRFLDIEIDPSFRRWGRFDRSCRTSDDQGTVILARQDRSDLTVREAQTLCNFAQHVVGALLKGNLGLGGAKKKKEEVMPLVTPEKFAQYSKEQETAAAAKEE